MILAEVVLVGLLMSLVSGGSLRRLAAEPLKGEMALLILLPVQLLWPVASRRFELSCEFSIVAWLLMMAGLAVVLMLNSPRRWQLAVAALGIAANILAIGLNQAMPVSISAASEVGIRRSEARSALAADCLHEEVKDETKLPLLADVIPVPGPSWHGGVISVGDILLSLGLGAWVFAASRDGRSSMNTR